MASKDRDYSALTRQHSSGDISEPWVRLQKKAFTAWCNEHLRKREVFIGDLGTELTDGVKLLHLLELLSNYKVEFGKWVKAPKTRFEKLQNVSWGLKFMTSQGIKIVAIGPEDLVDPKLKLILGLIWLLILKYLVSKGSNSGSAKADTIAWVRKRTGNDAIKDFNPATWQDGKVYCGIVHSMKPDDRINPDKLDPTQGLKNVQTAMDIAEKELGVPHILDPEDILAPEELSFITYLSILRDKAADVEAGKVATPRSVPAPAVETPRKEYNATIGCDPTAPAVGDAATFKVQLKEQAGPLVIKGGQNLKAQITDAAGDAVPTEPKDQNDGSWVLPWKPTKGGEHKLVVTVDDKPAGKPFTVNVSGGGADPTKSTLTFSPASPSPVGQPVTANLQLNDASGNKVASIGDTPVRAILASPEGETPLMHKDAGNGVAAFTFTPTKAGDHNIKTFVANKPSATGLHKAIDNSDGAHSTVDLSPAKPKVGDKVTAKVAIKDANGKPATPAADSVRAVLAAPEGEKPLPLTNNNDGTFTGVFTPTKPGDHTVKASVADKPIKPSTVNVAAGVSPSKSDVKVEPAEPVVGDNVTATVQLRDDAGKEADGADAKVEGVVKTPEGDKPLTFAPAKPAAPGKFTAPFTPKTAGDYAVAPTVNGAPIAPATFAVKPALDAGSSKLDVKPASPVEGDEVTAKLTLHAKDGSPIAPAGHQADAKVTGPDNKPVTSTTTPEGDGFAIKFPVKAAGPYKVAPTVDGKNVPEKTVQVAADVDPKGTKVAVEPAAPLLNDKVNAKITLADKKGKPRTTGGPKVTAKLASPDGKTESPAVKDNGDGTYSLSFPANAVGTFNLTPSVNDEAAPATAIPVSSNADASHAGVSITPSEPKVGDKCTATVQLKDKSGAPLTSAAGVTVKAMLAAPGAAPAPLALTDGKNGTFKGDFTPTTAGKHEVSATVNDAAVPSTSVNVKANVDPKKSTVTVDPAAPTAGDKAKATIKLVDANGKPLTSGGVPVEASLVGPDGKETPVKVTDNGDGTFSAELPLDKPGDYVLNVKADGKPLEPTKVPVKANVDPTKTTVTVDPAAPTAGDKTKATIKPVDANGNPIKGKLPVEATLIGPDGKEIPVKVTDNGDGTYSVDLPTDKPGDYTLKPKVDGKPLEPTKVHVKPNVDPSKTTVTVDPAAPTAGDKTKATIKPVDANGNPIKGKVPVEATLIGPDGKEIPVTVTDNGDGTYSVDLPTDKPGDYILKPKVDGKPLEPTKVHVKPNVDPSKTTVTVDPATPTAGDKTKATIKPVDANGNPIKGKLPVEATLIGPDGKEIPVKVTDNGDGTYSVDLPTDKPGDYTLKPKVDGKPLEPTKVHVKPNVDPKKSSVSVEPAAPVAGDKAKATVKLADSKGKPLTTGGVPVEASFVGPDSKDIPVKVNDNNDGTYGIDLPVKNPGEHVLNVKADGKPLEPTKVPVKANVDPSKTTVTVDPATPVAGDKPKATIKPVDADGNPIKGKLPVEATLIGPDGKEIPVKVTDNGDGTYSVDLPTDKPGDYTLKPKVDGKPLEPTKVHVKPNVDPSKSSASGPGLKNAVVGRPAPFVCEAKTPQGKVVPDAQFQVSVAGPDGKEIKAEEKPKNNFAYTAPAPGQVTVTVKVADANVPGSPFTVPVSPAAAPSKTTTEFSPEAPHQGDKVAVKVQLKDAEGKPVTYGGDKVTAGLLTPGSTKPEDIKLRDNEDGTYTGHFQADHVGPHVVEPKVNGESAPASQVQVKPAVDPAQCKAHGPGLRHAVVGRKAEFFVEALNANGKRVDGVHANVAIKSEQGPLKVDQPPATGKVPHQGHGHAPVHFTPTHKGLHQVDITVEDKPIHGSPYRVSVENAPDAKHTDVSVTPAKPKVGDKIAAKAALKDAEGKPITYGGEKVDAALTGPNGEKVPVDVKDNNDGTFAVTTPTPLAKPGEHKLAVKVNDADGPVTPINVTPPVDLTKCKAKGDGLSKATVGKKSEFVVQARDKDDKPLAGVPFTVSVTGPKGEVIPVEAAPVTDKDGEVHVSYVAPMPGALTIKAQHDGGDIKGSPFTVTAKKPAAPKKSRSKWTFDVELVDEDGNDLTEAGSEPQVKMFDIKTPETLLPLKFKEAGAGRYKLEFTLPHAGEFEIQVTVDGEHVAGSPFRQTAHT